MTAMSDYDQTIALVLGGMGTQMKEMIASIKPFTSKSHPTHLDRMSTICHLIHVIALLSQFRGGYCYHPTYDLSKADRVKVFDGFHKLKECILFMEKSVMDIDAAKTFTTLVSVKGGMEKVLRDCEVIMQVICV